MKRQLLRNGQITLPREAVNLLHLRAGDLLEVNYDSRGIHLLPLAIEEFSDEEYAKLAHKLDSLKHMKGKVYTTTAGVRKHLDRLMKGR